MREILLHYILPIETNIKSLIAYYFPQEHSETYYLIYKNFDTNRKDANKNITELIAELQKQISSRASDPSIAHYLQKYGYVPLWVLNNILTLGTISKFYSLMQQKERQEISKTFRLSDNELESILTYISSIRNFCAHGNRLYCFRNKRPLCDTQLHALMGLDRTSKGEYVYGKRDLFAAMMAFKLTLSKNDFRRLVKEVDIAYKNFFSRAKIITEEMLFSSTGFPSDWKKKLLIDLSK